MLIIYTPEGEPAQEFVFRPGELMTPEAEALEECGGAAWSTFEEFGQRFMDGSLKARRAALWILLRRTNPRLRFADLVVRVDELTTKYDADELRRMRARIEADTRISEDDRAEALTEVDEALAELEPEPVGKDVPDATSTGSESPPQGMEPSPNS